MGSRKKINIEGPWCEAKTRRQIESGSWSGSQQGCSNKGTEQIDGHWVCWVHKDPKKRYGWN